MTNFGILAFASAASASRVAEEIFWNVDNSRYVKRVQKKDKIKTTIFKIEFNKFNFLQK